MANILNINLIVKADSAATLDSFAQKLGDQLGIPHQDSAQQLEEYLNFYNTRQDSGRGYWWDEMSGWLQFVVWISPTDLHLTLEIRDYKPLGEWSGKMLGFFPTIMLSGSMTDSTNLVAWELLTQENADGSRELSGSRKEGDQYPDDDPLSEEEVRRWEEELDNQPMDDDPSSEDLPF